MRVVGACSFAHTLSSYTTEKDTAIVKKSRAKMLSLLKQNFLLLVVVLSLTLLSQTHGEVNNVNKLDPSFVKGTKRALVVYVITGKKKKQKPTARQNDIRAALFGKEKYKNRLSLRKQMYKCSNGKLSLLPSLIKDSDNGIMKLRIKEDIVTGSNEAYFYEKVKKKLEDKGIFNMNIQVLFIVYPYGTYRDVGGEITKKWVAYADWDRSIQILVFNNKKILNSHVPAHEFGHSLGLGHAGEEENGIFKEYEDRTGYMGTTGSKTKINDRCFNAAKSWQLGWYDSNERIIDLNSNLLSERIKFAPVVHRKEATNEHTIVLRLENDQANYVLYAMYNKVSAFNRGTGDCKNGITMVYQEDGKENISGDLVKSNLLYCLKSGKSTNLQPGNLGLEFFKLEPRSSPNVPEVAHLCIYDKSQFISGIEACCNIFDEECCVNEDCTDQSLPICSRKKQCIPCNLSNNECCIDSDCKDPAFPICNSNFVCEPCNPNNRMMLSGQSRRQQELCKRPELSQREILIELYESTGGNYSWKTNYKWLSDYHECEWEGIQCIDNEVVAIYRNSNGLTGSIPQSIGQLTTLVILDLKNNNISGFIPSSIGNLAKLRQLILSNNKLTGPISSPIAGLQELAWLYLDNNSLSGSIPSSIGSMGSQTQWQLSILLDENKLSGSIPSTIGNLSTLHQLHLQSNDLSGSIPSSIGGLVKLVRLYLQDNNLSGSIPSTIGQMKKLDSLYLQNNNLSGAIPSTISQLSDLDYLLLSSNNNLSGTIPESVCATTLAIDVCHTLVICSCTEYGYHSTCNKIPCT